MRVVLSGGPSELERTAAAAIGQAMREPCLDLVGKDTLEQSKALLQRASVVLTPDAGPAHIASALGTPVIGLYAATWSRRSGPYNSLDLCVDRYAEAARKYRNREAAELRWGHRIEEPGVMDLVRPAEVIERLQASSSRQGTATQLQQPGP
jgi:heptosyltransferase I